MLTAFKGLEGFRGDFFSTTLFCFTLPLFLLFE
jgi:hypothetical protein